MSRSIFLTMLIVAVVEVNTIMTLESSNRSAESRNAYPLSFACNGLMVIAAALMSLEMTAIIGPRLAAGLLFFVAAAGLTLTAIKRMNTDGTEQQTQTLRRLLEFTNSIHGAGKTQQIFDALSHSLQTELNLAGLMILGNDPRGTAGMTVHTRVPKSLCSSDSIADMDQAMCPCLRQNLPREFKPSCSPVRCAVDDAINLGSDHAAYCIPFTIGRGHCLVHMLLSPGQVWSEQQKQVAQAYINAACSALMSLQLLLDAEQRSLTDPLTQLYNRLSMEQLLQREMALAERHDLSFSLVVMDLDEFKQVNDTFGHAAGDHLLKSLADCIRMTLRKTDLAFRFGGDEFIIALPQTSVAQARQVVEKLRQAFAAVDVESAIANMETPPTLSIGLAERDRVNHLTTLPALISAADQALYDAKRQSRNCVSVYSAAA